VPNFLQVVRDPLLLVRNWGHVVMRAGCAAADANGASVR
jgi:hypothetical protein